jgi:adenine-specific DNA-methyltransferase
VFITKISQKDTHRFNSHTVVYADPPYFKEHYSRYYHVLDTFFLYDFPYLTFNNLLDAITVGKYRENRIASTFGLRSQASGAFQILINKAKDLKSPLIISYADSSIVKKDHLENIIKDSGLKLEVLAKQLMHSGQGQKRNKIVTENLFICS